MDQLFLNVLSGHHLAVAGTIRVWIGVASFDVQVDRWPWGWCISLGVQLDPPGAHPADFVYVLLEMGLDLGFGGVCTRVLRRRENRMHRTRERHAGATRFQLGHQCLQPTSALVLEPNISVAVMAAGNLGPAESICSPPQSCLAASVARAGRGNLGLDLCDGEMKSDAQ